MHKRTAFTLVELLVVIAIIALLMSILMPALARVRNQAKDVLDRSNLKQWALIFSMYTGGNDGCFPVGRAPGRPSGLWPPVLRSYYQEEKIRVCPMATKPEYNLDQSPGPGFGKNPFSAWGIFDGTGWTEKGDYGSYGMNEYLYNPPAEIEVLWSHPTKNFWRTINVRGTTNIPMFLDCYWRGGCPEHYDRPPQWDGEVEPGAGVDEMKRFCLNRHDGALNGAFLDFSVRKIGLKQLWKFKWHRKFNLNEGPVVWPEWMRNCRDY
jgi:prepilin-type N-terminal cleavage/methylation domain-containing protein/prepilin-type processing-associated H-X9-DG protein